MASDSVADVLAALRAPAAAERCAAAAALLERVDLNVAHAAAARSSNPTDEEAVACLEAATAACLDAAVFFAGSDACTALAVMLRGGAAEQLAASRALQCIFNTLGAMLADNQPRLENVARPAAAQLWAAGGAELLCELMVAAPDCATAFAACRALYGAVDTGGWSPEATQSLDTDAALSGLLALAGGHIQVPHLLSPRNAALYLIRSIVTHCGRTLCSPTVLAGGAIPLLTAIVSEQQGLSAHAAETLSLALHCDPEGFIAALAPYRSALLRTLFNVLLQSDFAKRSEFNLLSTLIEGADAAAGESWVEALLCSELLPQLSHICGAVAPQQLAQWRRSGQRGGMLALAPSIATPAVCATQPKAAALIAGLLVGAPQGGAVKAAVGQLQAAVMRSTALRDATPLSAKAIRNLHTAHAKQRRAAAAAGDMRAMSVLLSDADAVAAAQRRPLLLASRQAPTARARTALARANVLHCQSMLAHCTADDILEEWAQINSVGSLFPRIIGDASATTAFTFTTGLHYTVGGPEVVVLADVEGVAVNALSLLSGQICLTAATQVVHAAAGASADVAPRLAQEGLMLAEREAGIVPWAYEQLGGGAAVPPHVAEAAAQVVWQLHAIRPGCSPEAAETLRVTGALEHPDGWYASTFVGRKLAVFYNDVACVSDDALWSVPTLLCSVACSLSAAGDAGAVIADALRSLASATLASGHAGECECHTCNVRRMAGSLCGNAACADRWRSPKKLACAGCRKVTYCCRACQTADWARHRKECAGAKEA